MRIAVFIKSTTFHKGYGGLETQNKVLCEGLAKHGHRITVFAPQKELTVSTTTENNISYKFIPGIYRLGIFADFDKNNWFNCSYKAFLDEHETERFDLIIGQSAAALGVINHKRELGIKIISISHGTIIGEYKSAIRDITSVKNLTKWILDAVFVLRVFFGRQRKFIYGSDKIVAVSTAVKKALIDETFVSDDFITIIHNGLDPKLFDGFKKKSTKGVAAKDNLVNILYVGRVIRAKGLFILLSVLKEIKEIAEKNVCLHIVGEGADLAALKEAVQQLGLSDKVIFYGNLPHQDALKKMFESDIFVLPSLRVEGLPMTLVEAMFAGLPIIASNIGGNSDIVENDITGYLVKSGDKNALKERLLALMESKKICQEFGKNAKIKALEVFSLDVMLDKYEDVIKEVLTLR